LSPGVQRALTSGVLGSGVDSRDWWIDRLWICAPPYIASKRMWKSGMECGMNHEHRLTMAGGCMRLRVSDRLCRLVDTGAGVPIVIHRVADAQSWLAVRLNHAAGSHTLASLDSPRTCHI
jgi:hypothetical protein